MKQKCIFQLVLWILIVSCESGSLAQSIPKYESSQGFVAHEWGTFTTLHKSNGDLLSHLEVEEEHLPAFVHDLCFCPTFRTNTPGLIKGFPSIGNPTVIPANLQNVTVKMETPVLYFYSSDNKAKDISIDIKFKNGSISQWYPERSAGELYDATHYLYSPGYMLPAPPVNPQDLIIDFSNPRWGSIQWKVSVLPLNTTLKYTNDPSLETSIWISPRVTASNLVKTKDSAGQIEKFLFYRGVANFLQPIRVEFNLQHDLVISNKGTAPFKYVLVYEKRKDGNILIWWSGILDGQKIKVLIPPKTGLIDHVIEMENFVSKLVEAGLYEDEARAMLKTWDKSYFQHDGLKVFWIVPPAFTDSILPLKISPATNSTKRVLVGRSEVLSQEFEKQLAEMDSKNFNSAYAQDRFYLAYRDLIFNGIPTKWTDYDVVDKPILNPEENLFKVFPNPVTGNLTIQIRESGTLKIYRADGTLIYVSEKAIAGENALNTELFPKGIYTVKAEYINGGFDSKIIVKQ